MSDVKESPGDTQDEKENAKDSRNEGKEVRLEQIFDILGSLRNIISRSTNILLNEKDYGVGGYGPHAWVPKINENLPSRFEVIEIGSARTPYIVRKPLVETNIVNIDSLLTSTYAAVEHMTERTMVFLKEPKVMRMLRNHYIDPEGIGFPYASIAECVFDVNIVQHAITRYLQPVRRINNFNFSDGFVFRGTNNNEAMRNFFDVSQREMRILAETIEVEELRTRDGIPDSVKRPIHNNNVLYEVVVNPFVLTRMFNEIPRPMRFSAGMVIELQRPSVILGPIDANTLQKSASTAIVYITPRCKN